VHERGQRNAAARPARGRGVERLDRIELGQAPQAGPDARRGALQEEDAILPAQLEPGMLAPPANPAARLDRVALLRSRLRRGAQVAHRAEQAARRARDADRRPEVHQALRVRLDAARRQERRRRVPQLALAPASARSPPNASTRASTRLTLPSRIATRSPNENAAIAAAVERPMPGQRREPLARARELGAVLGDDRLRGAMQVAGPAVVAEPAPEREHVVERRRGERAHVGKAGDEALEVAEHGRDLRLLQHHLGEPDAVRIAALPGQPVAAVLALPVDDAAGEPRRQRVAAAQAWRCIASSSPTGTASSKRGRSSVSVANGAASAYARSASASSPVLAWNSSRRWSCVSISPIRSSSSPAADWIFSSVSRRRLNALRRSRSCESTCAETALFQSSSSLLAFSNTTRQLGDQHAPELLHELRLREAQREGQAEVLDVVALDQLQLAREAVEVERLALRRG
jgi:hypothetical protein